MPALGLQPSFAIGVGQSRARLSRPFSFLRSPPRLRKLSVCGVGHSRSSSVRFPPLDRVPEQARGVGQLVALSDREDEEAFALVGRADFRRREEACRKAVAHADQSCGDFGETEAEMMGDILEEDEGRFDFADDAGDMRPEVARIVRAPAFARDAERLAWIARSEDVHRAAPRAALEGSNIVPDRRAIQGRVFHPRHEDGRGEGVPLDVTHSTISGAGDGEPEIESTGTGAEGEAKQASVSGSGSTSGGKYSQLMHVTRRSYACAPVWPRYRRAGLRLRHRPAVPPSPL